MKTSTRFDKPGRDLFLGMKARDAHYESGAAISLAKLHLERASGVFGKNDACKGAGAHSGSVSFHLGVKEPDAAMHDAAKAKICALLGGTYTPLNQAASKP